MKAPGVVIRIKKKTPRVALFFGKNNATRGVFADRANLTNRCADDGERIDS
jgi:hypothetical protein